MDQGLFRYSRRPNYFGEATMWWGLAITVVHLPFGVLAFASPIVITYVVTAITGPMLERQFAERFGEAYEAYKARTSYFIPLPPKREAQRP